MVFCDHVGLHHTLSEALSIAQSRGKLAYEEVEFVDGLESPAEAFPNIVSWLITHNYSDQDIAKAIGGNVMRVLKDVWYR